MKKFLLIFLLFPAVTFSQKKIETKLNNIDISYEIFKKGSNDKKDTYSIYIQYTNNTGTDIYYSEVKRDENEMWRHFGTVSVSNTKGIFSGKGGILTGDRTKLKLHTGEAIYKIAKGKTYTSESTFTVEKGIEPLIIIKNGPVNLTTEIKDFID